MCDIQNYKNCRQQMIEVRTTVLDIDLWPWPKCMISAFSPKRAIVMTRTHT